MFEKFVKLTDHSCACHDLTNFESDACIKAGNGSHDNMIGKTHEITSGELILGKF